MRGEEIEQKRKREEERDSKTVDVRASHLVVAVWLRSCVDAAAQHCVWSKRTRVLLEALSSKWHLLLLSFHIYFSFCSFCGSE